VGHKVRLELLLGDPSIPRVNRGGADHVLELSDVAGPGVAPEELTGPLGEVGLGELAGQDGQGELQDVFAALAQRRKADLIAGQAVEEILAIEALNHRLTKVPVRRSDDPNVDAPQLARPYPEHFALLERPENLRLMLESHVPHLVEEERAAMCLLKEPGPRLVRPCEGAALVAEQLRLQELPGDRCAVHSDERTRRALALFMDPPGQKLLARAALTIDEHRPRHRCHPIGASERLAKPRARSDNLGLLPGHVFVDEGAPRVRLRGPLSLGDSGGVGSLE
jgi:hypothetical protein